MTNDYFRKSGGFQKLRTYQMSEIVYDETVKFTEVYIPKSDRTHDQMVQAARSGKQNIAEGSMASASNPDMEIKLTEVARASLVELKLDYEDFIRHYGFQPLTEEHPLFAELKKRRITTREALHVFIQQTLNDPIWIHQFEQLAEAALNNPQRSHNKSLSMTPWLVSNTMLYMLRGLDYMLMRQIESQKKAYRAAYQGKKHL